MIANPSNLGNFLIADNRCWGPGEHAARNAWRFWARPASPGRLRILLGRWSGVEAGLGAARGPGTTQISDNLPDSHQSGEAWAIRVSELLTMPTRFSIRLASRESRYSFERIDSASVTSYGRHLNGSSKDSVGEAQMLVK